MKRITIFHYHLRPGGVTSVIILGAKALIKYMPDLRMLRIVCGSDENTEKIQEEIETAITESNTGNNSIEFEIMVEPQIYYRNIEKLLTEEEIHNTAEYLLNKYADSFWWVHNYQLGKNPLFTAAMVYLSKDRTDQKILLHIHDFPECARYDNLKNLLNSGVENPYPAGEGTAYCLINSRDTEIMKTAGIPENRVFLLNNPVEDIPPENNDLSPEDKKNLLSRFFNHYAKSFPEAIPGAEIIFYPVRAIRRKNIIEAGLLTAVSQRPVNLVVSLPGVSAQEKAYSDTCKKCFTDGLIPGIWGSGTDNHPDVPSFPKMLQLCGLITSSSVQEGFGYLFINSVQLGTPLVARNLDILDGIRHFFPEKHTALYENFYVPIEKKTALELKDRYNKKLSVLTEYISEDAIEKIRTKTAELGSDGKIDFSFLPVEIQVQTLKLLSTSETLKKEIHYLNEKTMKKLYQLLDEGRYAPPRNISTFSLEAHSRSIEKIMAELYNDDKKTEKNGKVNQIQQKLLDRFAEPEYMRLLYDY